MCPRAQMRRPNFSELCKREVHEDSSSIPSTRSRGPTLEGAIISPVGIVGFLCTTRHEVPYLYIRIRIGCGAGKRKADPLVLGGDEGRIGLTMC
jgi:hypothetical protein